MSMYTSKIGITLTSITSAFGQIIPETPPLFWSYYSFSAGFWLLSTSSSPMYTSMNVQRLIVVPLVAPFNPLNFFQEFNDARQLHVHNGNSA